MFQYLFNIACVLVGDRIHVACCFTSWFLFTPVHAQADVCHAYQLLRRNGLKDENIVVFMADDIASSEENPRPGTLINRPGGPDVYKGVPKVRGEGGGGRRSQEGCRKVGRG